MGARSRQGAAVAVLLGSEEAPDEAREEVPEEAIDEPVDPPKQRGPVAGVTPLYAAALLKVALELRRAGHDGLEPLIERVIAGTPIERAAFQDYLRRNLSLLRRA